MDVERCSGTIVSIPFNRHTISALFYRLVTRKEQVEGRTAILRLHGMLGNLLDETEHYLPHALAEAGYSSLTMNTLLANLGLFFGFGIFDEAMPQIDAACDFLREVGFEKVVIAGHGLGGCMAVRYGALRGDPAKHPGIAGVIAIATPYSLPDATKRRWDRFGSSPTYEEVTWRARRVCDPEPGEPPAGDETILIERAHGGSRRPEHSEIYTLKTWWALAGPEAEGAKTYRQIGLIKPPILLVHGSHDSHIREAGTEEMARIAERAGNKDVTRVCLETDHTFDGSHDDLGRVIADWLDERFGGE